MSPTFDTAAAAAPTVAPRELERTIADVEAHLAALGTALKLQDAAAAEEAAAALHRALAQAVHRFGHAAKTGGVPPALRRRLARTSGQVAAQRDAVARATSALDRAIDVLMPSDAPVASVYGQSSGGSRSNGLAQA